MAGRHGTVVLAAGVYGTPVILQRFGIGAADHLRALGPGLQGWLDAAAARGFLPEEQTLGKALFSQAADGLFDLHLHPVCASNQTSQLHGRALIEVACMSLRSRGAVRSVSRDQAIRDRVVHYYHPVGTCAMGAAPAVMLAEQIALTLP